jgi:cytochrome c-type biogenesis protein CcmF
VRPTAAVSPQKLSFGAVLEVSQHGHLVTTLDTSRGFYPAQDVTLGVLGRFFAGQADSDVGLRAGLTKDLWAVANPDLTPLQPLIDQGDKIFGAAVSSTMTQMVAKHVPRSEADAILAPLWQKRDQAVAGIAARYISHPWAINFRLIVSPLVTWLWLGALIMGVGGLIALWPVPAPARRRARVAQRSDRPERSECPERAGSAAPVPAGSASLAVRERV